MDPIKEDMKRYEKFNKISGIILFVCIAFLGIMFLYGIYKNFMTIFVL